MILCIETKCKNLAKVLPKKRNMSYLTLPNKFSVFLFVILTGCQDSYTPTYSIYDVVKMIKTDNTNIAKSLTIVDDCTYFVKSTVGDYEIFYDLDDVTVINENTYKINFTVFDKMSGDSIDDTLDWIPEENQTGVLLSFDDYYWSWYAGLDLFDAYDIKATWFIIGRDEADRTNFARQAFGRGHDIGYHGADHKQMSNFQNDMSQFNFQAFGGTLSAFRASGMPVSSFAYPYGGCADWTHPLLLADYHIVRGYDKYFHVFDVNALKSGGYFPSKSIDYNKYNSDEMFEKDIRNMFIAVKFMGDGYVIPLTSHTISLTDTGWAIRPYHLEYVFQQGKKWKLRFYTFNDFDE
jgi:peptidoglycan/xylan/chitin deacetylase (PgdA/CDA1 family)